MAEKEKAENNTGETEAQTKEGKNAPEKLTTGGKESEYTTIVTGDIACTTKLEGVRIDFNYGARVKVPEGKWKVRIIDLRAAQVLCDGEYSNTVVASPVQYYVPWRIEVWQEGKMVFSHYMSLRGQRVYVKFISGAMGDSIAWLPYVEEFRKKHGCEIWVAVYTEVAELFRETYPELHFVPPGERPGAFYASYYLGCFFPPDDRTHQPSSWKLAGIQGAAANILGLPAASIRPELHPDCPRTIKEPYVCIAAQASAQAKYWNNPEGWIHLIAWLKEAGYRVLCIDRDKCYGTGWHFNQIPWGAEDFTGAKPLRERLELLSHADFFVGLGSGLSWLAWAAGIPVVLISGFSLPHTEFPTPYRVINYHVCNGCWEDDRCIFDHGDFFWCPRHADDDARRFECTRKINQYQVINTCRRLMEDHGLKPKG